MNTGNIIRMAREAGMVQDYDCFFSPGDQDMDVHITDLERFAALVAAAEREACEALYAHDDVQAPVGNSAWGEAYQEGWIAGARAYREAIRARGQA